MLIGLVEENGGRAITTTLTKGEAFTIPQGLMHFQQNLGCEPVQFLGSFPSRDPGTQTLMPSFVMLPDIVIAAMTNLDPDMVTALKERVMSQNNPSIDVACAKRCGITVPPAVPP